MKLSTILYIMGASSLVAGAPQDDEESTAPALPSFSRPTGRPTPPAFSSHSRSARPTASGRPPLPSLSLPGRPSFTVSVKPSHSGRPTRSGRPTKTSPPKPTATDDDGGDDGDDDLAL